MASMTFWLVNITKTYRGLGGCKRIEIYRPKSKKPDMSSHAGFLVLATSYSRTAYRRTTIGAAAFHCRVRNGNGWCHCATITRLRCRTGISLLRSDAGARPNSEDRGQLRAGVARSIALLN